VIISSMLPHGGAGGYADVAVCLDQIVFKPLSSQNGDVVQGSGSLLDSGETLPASPE